VLGAGADVVARGVAEDELTSRVHHAIPGASEGTTTASIDSFPFLGRLVATGRVDGVTVHQEGVTARGIRFTAIDVDLEGVHIDRGALARHRRVELTGIDRGTVTATVGLGELLRLAGSAAAGGVRLDLGVLFIGDVRLDLAGAPLLPCVTSLRFEGAAVALTCRLHDPPVELLPRTLATR
jgi:hypothetical protein